MKRSVRGLILVLLSTTVVAAAPHRIDIEVSGAVTIEHPGRYVLVRNIRGDSPVIDIRSNDVHLDLNGFSVTVDDPSGVALFVTPGLFESITVENGTLRGGQVCAAFDRVSRLTVRDLTTDCPVGLSFDDNSLVVVESNRIVAAERGIQIDSCDNCTISDNSVAGSLASGISIGFGSGIRIVENIVTQTGTAISAAGRGTVLRGNVVSECSTALAVGASYGLLEDNAISLCAEGIVFSDESQQNVYRANTVRGSGAALLDAGDGNVSHGDNYLPDLR